MLPAYGVVIGTYDHSGSHTGKWMHELIYLKANGETYEAAVDVNEPTGAFQYVLLNSMDAANFTTILSLTDGHHALGSNSTSGAIDYVRSPFGLSGQTWNTVTGDEAGNALAAAVATSTRVFIFGDYYTTPSPGVHDVHMNQGDPTDNAQFHALDGIWQDGCVIIQNADNSLSGYFGKFAAQSFNTDDNGFPL